MILYHGSNVAVLEPKLIQQNQKLYNQLVLSSEKALSYLNYMGIVPEEEL